MKISPDRRIVAIALLLVPSFVGHFIQLAGEDAPWTDWAHVRYFTTPGWHLFVPPWFPAIVAGALALSVIGLAARRRRSWLIAIIVLYAAHYFTYPYRIRNHMTHMLAELTMLGGVWVIAWLSGYRKPSLRVDRYAANGMAAVLCITYFFAALHKVNANFLAFDDRSSAVQGLTTFWIYGDLGSVPPRWAIAIAIYGTIVIEALAPIIAWRITALRVPAILTLFAFHFPHVAVMDVADYPMIASAFYPALFSRAHFRLLLRHVHPSAFTLAGATLGVAAQLWFMPWLGSLTGFGIFVAGLWGWSAGAMIRMVAYAKRARAMQGARAASVG